LLAGCIVDDQPIGLENCAEEKIKVKLKDPLKKVNLGSEQRKSPIFISVLLQKECKKEVG